MKHDDGKGNITWDSKDFIIPKYGTEKYWKHFRQALKDMDCLNPPNSTKEKR
jgi:hypothetical protein